MSVFPFTVTNGQSTLKCYWKGILSALSWFIIGLTWQPRKSWPTWTRRQTGNWLFLYVFIYLAVWKSWGSWIGMPHWIFVSTIIFSTIVWDFEDFWKLCGLCRFWSNCAHPVRRPADRYDDFSCGLYMMGFLIKIMHSQQTLNGIIIHYYHPCI